MRIFKLAIVSIVWIYIVTLILFGYILSYLARFLERPEDLRLLFDLPLLVNQIKELNEIIPRYSSFVIGSRRV